MSSIHLFLILSSVIFVVSMLSVFELLTVPAGKGAGVEESRDIVESVRSAAGRFDEEAVEPFVAPFESLLDGAAESGDGLVDTEGPESGNQQKSAR